MAQKLNHSTSKRAKDSSSYPTSIWQPSNVLPPVVDTKDNVKAPDLIYSSKILKDDLNDEFDEAQMLQLIPPKHRKNAQFLLDQFDKRGSELTWNSSGILYIDQDPIPNTNFFLLFPLLFKLNKIKLAGLNELVEKIKEMGLGDHIYRKIKSQTNLLESKKKSKP